MPVLLLADVASDDVHEANGRGTAPPMLLSALIVSAAVMPAARR